MFLFRLGVAGEYEQVEESQVLAGVSGELLEHVLERLDTETNTAAAGWFAQELRKIELMSKD